MEPEELVRKARSVGENAYKPYSEYSVGAALVTGEGTVYQGVNIETITLDMTSHAERTAMKTAITEGHRDFEVLALSTEKKDGAPPCATCRQFLAEFCGDDFPIYSDCGKQKEHEQYTLGELYPMAFRPERVQDVEESNF